MKTKIPTNKSNRNKGKTSKQQQRDNTKTLHKLWKKPVQIQERKK